MLPCINDDVLQGLPQNQIPTPCGPRSSVENLRLEEAVRSPAPNAMNNALCMGGVYRLILVLIPSHQPLNVHRGILESFQSILW
jgi:hypothetical protein